MLKRPLVIDKDQILDILRENPNIIRSETVQLLGKSQNTIKCHHEYFGGGI